MAISSQLSNIVSTRLGTLQGELEARIQTEAFKLVSKFANQCPSKKDLVRIIQTRNNLLKAINNTQKTANKFATLANSLKPPITIAKLILNLLKANPIPVAIGTPPNKDFGGLISTKTTGYLTSQADRLFKIIGLLESLENDIEGIESLVSSVEPSLNNVKDILETVNLSVEGCVNSIGNADSTGNAEDLADLLNQVRPLENTGSEGIPGTNFEYRGANGKTYNLAIIDDNTSETTAKRRVAVAKDSIGVIILRGQPSFSSDTQVLLDEIKFRIDNQLP